ncbi:MAG TPA: alginate lyase family protein [Candidatus Bathyarchaeia archaeon]|nr:alginate lyase family protein [Candidatus Bathyarchaeia archaeon]
MNKSLTVAGQQTAEQGFCTRPKLLLAACCLLLGGVSCTSHYVRGTPLDQPCGMLTPEQLAVIRDNIAREPWHGAYLALLENADQALERDPHPVEVFKVPSYYAHPRDHMQAKEPLSSDAQAAHTLALAWHLADAHQDAYAAKAASILDAWASTNTSVRGKESALVFCYAGTPLVLAADLLADNAAWRDGPRERFLEWTENVFLPAAQSISCRRNNWGAWSLFAISAGTSLLQAPGGIDECAAKLRRRIETHIDHNAELPHENRRTNSGMRYTAFALLAMTASAQIIRNNGGDDLFQHVDADGIGIEAALEKHFDYCLDPDSWPYRPATGVIGWLQRILYPRADSLLIPSPTADSGSLFEAMSAEYRNQAWENWTASARPIHGGRGWLQPTLTRQR